MSENQIAKGIVDAAIEAHGTLEVVEAKPHSPLRLFAPLRLRAFALKSGFRERTPMSLNAQSQSPRSNARPNKPSPLAGSRAP